MTDCCSSKILTMCFELVRQRDTYQGGLQLIHVTSIVCDAMRRGRGEL